jgi:hypothetical protein
MESERGRELLSRHLGVGLVDLNCGDCWRGRERINTPSGPNGRISVVVPHLTLRHYHSQGTALQHLLGQQRSRF